MILFHQFSPRVPCLWPKYGRYLWKLRLRSSQLLAQQGCIQESDLLMVMDRAGNGRRSPCSDTQVTVRVTRSGWPSRIHLGDVRRVLCRSRLLVTGKGPVAASWCAVHQPLPSCDKCHCQSLVILAWHTAFPLCYWRGFLGFLRRASIIRHISLF